MGDWNDNSHYSIFNELIKEKFSQRKPDNFILEKLEQKGSIIIWHLLDVVPMFRNVRNKDSRDIPGSSLKVL